MHHRHLMIAVTVVATLCLAVGAAGGVAAQESPPDLPAAYHGELTVNGEAPEDGVLVEAVANGTVHDSIITDPDGSIGGPNISENKLEVQEPNGEPVSFQIGGEPATIVSYNRESVNTETIPKEGGAQEVAIDADASQIQSIFNISINNATTPITNDEPLEIKITVANSGSIDDVQTVQLLDFDGEVVVNQTVSIDPNQTRELTLTWEDPNVGEGELTVRSADDENQVGVEINPPPAPPIAEQPAGGAGAGPAVDGESGTAESDGENGTNTIQPEDVISDVANGTPRFWDEQAVISDTNLSVSQVRFGEAAKIASITWRTADINGSVGVVDFESAPTETTAVPGKSIGVTQLSVPEKAASTSAFIEVRVDRETLTQRSIESPDELTVHRYDSDSQEWVLLPTSIKTETSSEILLLAEANKFSFFAVSATGEPTATIETPDNITLGEEATLFGNKSTTPYGELVEYEWSINGERRNGDVVRHVFNESGDVRISLNVTNDAGEHDESSATISIQETPQDETPDETTDDGSGFNIVIAIAGLIGAALFARVYQKHQ